MNIKRVLSALFLLCGIWSYAFSNSTDKNTEDTFYHEVAILKKAYPSVEFKIDYDEELNDYLLIVTSYKKTNVLYWANGLYLPKNQLANKEKYSVVFERYGEKILDPAEMSEEQIERIRNYSSKENRTSRYASKFLFNAIFDAWTRKSTESHLVRNRFLGKWHSVHAMLVPHLDEIERQIYELAKTDKEVDAFVKNLASADSYSWREIRDSGARSFHSYGTAVDILPYGWTKKITYWGFERGEGNNDWMLIPVEKRWMPPKKVVDIFLSEGFIWGGYWALWDNMHFDYRPELVLHSRGSH